MFGKHVIHQLSTYEHGELPAAERATFEAHLQTCAKCRAAYDEIRFGARLASSLSVSKAPELVRNEVQLAPPLGRHRWMPRVAFATTLLAAIVAVAIYIGGRQATTAPSWEVSGLPGTERLRRGEV